MKRLLFAAALLGCAALLYSQEQSSSAPPPIPSNPDSLFGPSSTDTSSGSTAATGATGTNGKNQTEPTGSSAGTSNTAPSGSSSGSSQSTESMFQGGMVQNVQTGKAKETGNAAVALLTNQGIQLGGSIESTYTAYGIWGGAYPDLKDLSKNFSNLLYPVLQGTLYFDARPDQHFRVFGKAIASYPFQISGLSGTTTASSLTTNSLGIPATQSVAPNIDIFELYSDFDYKHKVYFRVGKQVVNWGVGYFFSPADVISLTPVDPQNPTVEREGPVALKMNVPFAEVDNLYLYLIANQAFATNGSFQVNDIAVAPKAEFVLGDYEFALGGYYQRNQRPKAMVTATGSIGKIGVFGEAVVSRGADGTLVRQSSSSPLGYETYTDTTTPYFSGTAGFSYVQSDWHLSLYAQYYYNGQGYADPSLEKEAYTLYGLQTAASLSGQPAPFSPSLSLQDVQQPGRNYGAAVASWSNILDSNVTLSLFWEGNFSDGSGIVSPSVTYQPFDHASFTAATHVAYGAKDTQFIQAGHLSVSFEASLGTGNF